MTAVVVPTGRTQVLDPARHADGTPYRWGMLCRDGEQAVFSDTFEGLCEALVPGYDKQVPPKERRLTLAMYAGAQQVIAQAALTAGRALTEQEHRIVTSPRHGPVPVRVWSSPVPLVIIDLDYAPFAPYPLPRPEGAGQVIVIETGSPEAFIRSLNRTGRIHLLTPV